MMTERARWSNRVHAHRSSPLVKEQALARELDVDDAVIHRGDPQFDRLGVPQHVVGQPLILIRVLARYAEHDALADASHAGEDADIREPSPHPLDSQVELDGALALGQLPREHHREALACVDTHERRRQGTDRERGHDRAEAEHLATSWLRRHGCSIHDVALELTRQLGCVGASAQGEGPIMWDMTAPGSFERRLDLLDRRLVRHDLRARSDQHGLRPARIAGPQRVRDREAGVVDHRMMQLERVGPDVELVDAERAFEVVQEREDDESALVLGIMNVAPDRGFLAARASVEARTKHDHVAITQVGVEIDGLAVLIEADDVGRGAGPWLWVLLARLAELDAIAHRLRGAVESIAAAGHQ